MKKVVEYINGSYLPITESWIYNQIKNLNQYKPIIYANYLENVTLFPLIDVKIRTLYLKGKLYNPWVLANKIFNKVFGFYFPITFYLLLDKPDILHAHFGITGYNSVFLKKIFNFKLITTFYGYD